MRRRKKGYKVCRKCKAIVPANVDKCPYCGSTEFAEEYIGVIYVFDPEQSEVAKVLEIKNEGKFAIKVRY